LTLRTLLNNINCFSKIIAPKNENTGSSSEAGFSWFLTKIIFAKFCDVCGQKDLFCILHLTMNLRMNLVEKLVMQINHHKFKCAFNFDPQLEIRDKAAVMIEL
jgi:hypothetical protein